MTVSDSLAYVDTYTPALYDICTYIFRSVALKIKKIGQTEVLASVSGSIYIYIYTYTYIYILNL